MEKLRVLLKGLGLIAALACVGYFFAHSELGSALNERWMDQRVRGHGLEGVLLFLAIGALFTAVGLPRQLIAFLAGYGFGLALGTLLGTVATLFGCLLSFYYARLFGRGLLHGRLGPRATRLNRFIGHHPFSMTLLVRLLPVGSNVLTNLAAGLSQAPAPAFFLASFLGFLPQSLIFALVGSGIQVAPMLHMLIAAALFLASAILGLYLYRHHRHGLSIADDVDAALGEPHE